jgi:serine/threonine protein kinase
MTPSPRGVHDADGRNPVERLAEDYATRLRRGEPVSVEEYAKRYPDLASELRRVLRPIAMLEKAAVEIPQSPSPPVPDALEPDTESIAGYRIVREIGRGGMGVVYEAEQLSLGRRVALKILGGATPRTDEHLQRFRREAEAAASLHHTNIVPVFGAGEDGGRSYYVMQLIEGVTLQAVLGALRTRAEGRRRRSGGADDEDGPPSQVEHTATRFLQSSARERGARAAGEHLLAHRPDYWTRVAKLGVAIARALEHSHQRGILHRDIKPSNIMLDRRGMVWVTDFGLAKPLEGADLTNTGDALGTVRYMAPEQIHGKADPRSDLHSLGLTLFEFLALRPAYEGEQNGALLSRKLASAPALPKKPIPHVPRDLETIVRRACAVEPRYRYQRAADLEADLRCYLEDRPISARRAGVLERSWRLARRNPTVASLWSAVGLLLVAAVLVFAIATHGTQEALALAAEENRRVGHALHQAQEERRKAIVSAALAESESSRAEENLRIALEAFDGIFRNIASRGTSGSLNIVLDRELSGVTPADVRLLETLLGFFDRFADRNRVNLEAEAAAARKQVGDIQHRLGRIEEAIASYREALDAYGSLDRAKGKPVYALERARVLNAIATAESRRGVIRSAFKHYREARALLERSPDSTREALRVELARNLLLTATVAERTGMQRSDASLGTGRRGRGRRGPARARSGGRRPDRNASMRRTTARRAIAILARLVNDAPAHPEYRFLLVRAYRAGIHEASGDARPDQAESLLAKAIEHLESLVHEFPDSPAFHYELAETLCCLPRDDGTYARRVERALEICRELLAAHPELPEVQCLFGQCRAQKARLLAAGADLSRAAAEYERALSHLRASADRFPTVLLVQSACAETLISLAKLRITQGNRGAASRLLAEAQQRVDAFRSRSKTTRPVLPDLRAELRRQTARVE